MAEASVSASPSMFNSGEKRTVDEKGKDVRQQNIAAARAISDAIRTSLGPKGMDKMIQASKGPVIITNDGATILKEISVTNPTAKMLVDLSRSQDVEAGDGTTSVVVIAGALLEACEDLLTRGIHPQKIAQCFSMAARRCEDILRSMSIPVELNDREALIQSASTALNSKVVSHSSACLAPVAVDAVLNVIDPLIPNDVDLRNIKVVQKLGATVDETELVNGLVFADQKISRGAGGRTTVKDAKIGLIQFCLSPPKTDMQNTVTIKDYASMDRLRREERLIIAKMVKKIQETGCNTLLIQKSILRDAVTELSLDYLAKAKILVIRDIERDEVEFVARTLGCEPVASLDHFTADKLGHADVVTEEDLGSGGRIVRVTGVPGKGTVCVLCRASNSLMLEEAGRSFHDSLCVVRSIVKTQALLPGGGAPEIELSQKLSEWARTLPGVQQICVRAYAEALTTIPATLAENAGLGAIESVAELMSRHAKGEKNIGINVKKGARTADMIESNVVQPLLVTLSSVMLATETVMMILKIDDMVYTR
eukprot:GHVO01005887.1.p1 GENE.GHVO01005887.1~~GHVO01005887.1.p1  ORF type:complete len:548 (+),score=105.97 GHVO01005887.1:31-1644(+)